MVPKEPPLPTPSNLPFQAAGGGNHNSNRMSDLCVAFTAPMMRQNGTATVTFFQLSRGPTATDAVNGGCTNSAEFTDHGGFPSSARAAHALTSESVALSFAPKAVMNNKKSKEIKIFFFIL